MKLAVTGHRPKSLNVPDPYSADVRDALYRTALASLEYLQPTVVYVGMALGWDTAVARACKAQGVWYIACTVEGQSARWNVEARAEYEYLLASATAQRVSPHPGTLGLMERNTYMVEQADRLLTLWNGTPKGGTFQAIQTALQLEIPISHAWKRFQKELAGETIHGS